MFKSQSSFQNSFFGGFAYQNIINRHQNHLLVRLNKTIDLSFIEELVKDCYTPDNGRVAYNPVIMFKILFLQTLYDKSDRKIAEAVDTNILFRHFVGLSLDDETPHWTLLGKFKERLGGNKFNRIFNQIVKLALKAGLLNDKLRIIDCSDIRAKVDISKLKKDQQDDNDQEYIDRGTPDPEASIGHKSKNKSWYGYKTGILLDAQSEIVTAVETTTASPHDVNHLEDLVEKDIQTTKGFKRLTGDKGFVGKTEFLKTKGIADNIIRKNNMEQPKRKSYQKDKQQRPCIEHKFAEGKSYHRLGKAKYWGRLKVHIQSLLVYLTMNLKKIVNFLLPAPA
jgi:IS5 family transposase